MKLPVFWTKVLRDASEHPSRVALVALAVSIGTAALCAGLSSRVILTHEIDASFERSHPATAVFAVDKATPALIEIAPSQRPRRWTVGGSRMEANSGRR